MRSLAPALRGRVTRRAVVHSPHTWTATGATFLIFAVSDLVVSFTVDVVDVHRLWALSAAIAIIGLTILSTRPPERGSLPAHLLVGAVYGGVSFAVWAHAAQGSGPIITGMFAPVLIALWIKDRRQVASHLLLASALLITAASLGGNDPQTLVAVAIFLPGSVLLYLVTNRVLDVLDAQGAALDDLALRDPLTGVGNRRALEEELAAELIRHRSSGRPFALVDFDIADLDGLSDRVGRSAADSVLVGVANVLTRQAAPEGATVACDGTRFLVILPDRRADAAQRFAQQVRDAVPAHVGGAELQLRAGVASFPSDGTSSAALCALAGERRATAVPLARNVRADGGAAWPVVLGEFDVGQLPAASLERAARRTLANSRLLWTALGLGLVLYTAVPGVAYLLIDDFAGPNFVYVLAFGVLAGLVVLASRPPRIGGWLNHVAVATGYLLPTSAMLAAAPHASWAVGTALLTPLLIVARLTDRRQIVAHLALATALVPVVGVLVGFDAMAWVATAALGFNTWVLGLCTTVVLEAAERQSDEIELLVLRDPLTGTGNRVMLRERLAGELTRHETLQMPLVLMQFDVPEFAGFAAEHGRGAANRLLRSLAMAAANAVGPKATVARLADSTFGILLPLTDFSILVESRDTELDALQAALNEALPAADALTVRMGFAQYPEDASDADKLEALAVYRRTAQAGEAAPLLEFSSHARKSRRPPPRTAA